MPVHRYLLVWLACIAWCMSALGGGHDERADPPPVVQPAAPPLLTLDSPAEREKFVHNRDSDPRRPPVIVLTNGRYELSTKADFDTSTGSVEVTRTGLSNIFVIGPEHDVQIAVPIDHEVSHYRFRDGTSLTPDGRYPILDGEQWVLAPNIEAKIDDTYGWFAGGLITVAGQENLSHHADSYGGFAGVRYKPDSSLTLRAGLSGFTQLEDDPLILPAVQFEWKLDERTRLAAEGPQLRFEYDLNEAWTVKLAAAWEFRSYRLDDNAPLPNGLFKEERLPITLKLEYVPHAALRFNVWTGFNAYQHFETTDSEGVRYRDERVDPTAIVGASFELIF